MADRRPLTVVSGTTRELPSGDLLPTGALGSEGADAGVFLRGDQTWAAGLASVTATLHRSPNAITSLFIYDVSRDSDGGAWTEKCQHTSWYNETIYGKWLGAQASEAAARAVTGATTDDYFQLTTDGKFYKLNAGSGTTEIFRGRKRDFPKLAAIVAEAASVTIYDLTEPGRPMWMRFFNTSGLYQYIIASNVTVNSLAASNGQLILSESGQGVAQINFLLDSAFNYRSNGLYKLLGNIANRNVAQNVVNLIDQTKTVASGTTNAVAMTVLPDAPVDPVTGLKVPTIAVATAGGISVIKYDGTVVNSANVGAAVGVTFDNQGYIWANAGNSGFYYSRTAVKSSGLSASFSTILFRYDVNDITLALYVPINAGGIVVGRQLTPVYINLLKPNQGTSGKGLYTSIYNTHNPGWLCGNTRRAYLASNRVETVGPSTELITNGTFDTDIGWTLGEGWSIAVGVATHSTATAYPEISISNLLVVGKSYRVTVEVTQKTSGTFFIGSTSGVGINYLLVTGGVGTYSGLFIANTTTFSAVSQNFIGSIDNISVKEAIPDRSYKAANATIYGTLTAAAVNTGNDLVAYSGFSGTNYLQEPYSADLDFGTGEWSASAWVNVPTNNAAAAIIASRRGASGAYVNFGVDATNKLTATAYDGTTTRTVTTTAAYNTATWTKVRANYTTDGTLSLLVNGVQVAATYGTPLLTLNNANAVLTIGNSYALDAPFPGSIALLKFSATVPTAEQSVFMYEQEKALFNTGAKCVLPASTSVLDLAYDDATGTWSALQATHESTWSGLVRTSTQTPSAGAFTKSGAGSGVKLLSRSTTNPGVDVWLPSKNLRTKDVKSQTKDLVALDFVGGFTATTTSGSTAITAVSGVSIPPGVSLLGVRVSGSGIPTNTVIQSINGSTYYLSAAATASASGVQIGLVDFPLPVGYEAKVVSLSGAFKQEGSTKDWTRLFDGFKETVRFAVAPAYDAWVQIQAIRSET